MSIGRERQTDKKPIGKTNKQTGVARGHKNICARFALNQNCDPTGYFTYLSISNVRIL